MAGERTNVAENVTTLGGCTFSGIILTWPVGRLNSHVSCSMTCLTGLFYRWHSDVVDQFVCDLEVSVSTSQSIKLSVEFDSSLPELQPRCQKTCWQLNHWYVHISACHSRHTILDIFYNMCPITFTSVHLYGLTCISGSEADGQVELNEKAAEPVTTVQDCVPIFINVTWLLYQWWQNCVFLRRPHDISSHVLRWHKQVF